MFDKDYLNLTENYEFDVKVFDEDKVFAGNLKLSPQKCSLRVMGERSPSQDFSNSKTIKCSTLRLYFTLHELILTQMSSQLLQISDGEHIGFFEFEFNVGFVTYSKDHNHFNKAIKGFVIDAPILKNWIGHTTIQNKILDSHNKKTLNPIDTCEFQTKLKNYGALGLSYKITSGYDSFGSTFKSHPEFIILFNSLKEIDLLHEEIKKTYNLLALFMGSDFDINLVKLIPHENYNTPNLSVYFSWNFATRLDYVLFPLGHNLRFDQLGLPPLPLISFENYYNLSEADITFFSRYHGYCRMKSYEEKFLGFFRLLEKLTYKEKSYVTEESLHTILLKSKKYITKRLDGKTRDIKSLLDRIPHLNKSKYNTQACISNFYDTLPSELKDSISLKKINLKEICKLRNDITHANHFFVTEEELIKYTLFIKVLLYLALIEKIGIDIQQHWRIATRINPFYLLQSNNVVITDIND